MPFNSDEVKERFKRNHPGYFEKKNAEYYELHKEERKAERRRRYAENTEAEKAYQQKYYGENRVEILEKQKRNPNRKEYFRKYYRDLKKRVIDAYGGKCVCCGCDYFEFLTIGHVNGGGRKDRAKRAGAGFYAWLEKNGFPKEGYELQCMNCNFSLGMYGYCPHQT